MCRNICLWLAAVICSLSVATSCRAQEMIFQMMPEIPQSLTEPSQRANYLAMHYWDKFDFQDTALMMKDNLLERSFVDFCEVLTVSQKDTANLSINILTEKAEKQKYIYKQIFEFSEHYLNESASPVFNEDRFKAFLNKFINSDVLDETEKIRPKFLLENINKNNIGSIAADFKYAQKDETTGTLHTIESEYILLYFNDPDCDDCKIMIKKLIASPQINKLIDNHILKILTVYTGDEIDNWKAHSSEVLNSWIYTRDAEQRINSEGLYNIKQYPTLYLLDKDKRVVLKDTDYEQLEKYFNDNGRQ